MAAGLDSMLQSWDCLRAYAFPPFAMMRSVLNRVSISSQLELILFAPLWIQKEWFPDLLEFLVEPPIRLPLRRDLLRQPHFHRFHLNLRMLKLHAWRLSSVRLGTPDSLRMWLSKLPSLEEHQLD